MKVLVQLAVCALVVVVIGFAILRTQFALGIGAQSKADHEAIQGPWTIVHAEIDGVDMPPRMINDSGITFFDGDTMLLMNHKNDFVVDARSGLSWIDIRNSKMRYQGIYQLDGDSLQICISRNAKRPDDFTTTPDSTRMLLLLRR